MTTDQLLNTVAAMTPETYTENQKEFVLAVAKLYYEAGFTDGQRSVIATENRILARKGA